jgi:Fur family ferric uptake transcriptional regulator
VGLTTVYRTLQGLADAGEVDVLRTSGGEAIYRRCATGEHHHHLVCRSCGASVEVASDEVERWAATTAKLHGFTEVEHTAELYGVCGTCNDP